MAACESGCTCGCCAGAGGETPVATVNRPGLPAITYRAGTHGQFKRSMLADLSSADKPALSRLQTRDDDDFGVAFCDAAAMLCDSLTFYQERIANEHYLRTANERRSVLELARLIGYQLAPGVAADTHLAFTLDETSTPEVPTPRRVKIPAGTRAQSVPPPDQRPQTFETVHDFEARREWNTIRPQLTVPKPPRAGSRFVWIDGVDHNIRVGDVIAIVASERQQQPGSRRWEARRLSGVAINHVFNVTQLRWTAPLTHRAPHPADRKARVFVFKDQAAIFGHNAPDWAGQPDTFRASYLGLTKPEDISADERREWPDFTILSPGGNALPPDRFITPTADEVASLMDDTVKATLLAQGRSVITTTMRAAMTGGDAVQQAVNGTFTAGQNWNDVLKAGPDALRDAWESKVASVLSNLANIGNIGTEVGTSVGSSVESGLQELGETLAAAIDSFS